MLRLAVILSLAAWPAVASDFRTLVGHGGPVMDAAVSPDGAHALTASFDNSVGYWTLGNDEVTWLEGHRAAVKTVTFLGETLAASGGDDFAVEIWDLSTGLSRHRLEGHKGQVSGLAQSPDGRRLASASWDGTIRLWDIASGKSLSVMTGHSGAVSDIVFSHDGTLLYSASADGTIRVWDVSTGQETRLLVKHGFGVNKLLLGEGWLAYGAVDGGTRILDIVSDETIADLTLERRPILSMAISPDQSLMAVGDGEGYVMTVTTADWRIANDYKAAANGPVWSLAFTADSQSLLAGGIDDAAYVWPVIHSLDAPIMSARQRGFLRDPGEMSNGERQFRRKCSICHSLTEDGVRRAGPTLAGLFGRPAGSVAGYIYSDTVAKLGIDWTEDTIDQLFDLGPDHFIPGSKMPMQRIVEPQDRRDLIEYLRNNT
jgi:cytochrome c